MEEAIASAEVQVFGESEGGQTMNQWLTGFANFMMHSEN